MEFYAHVAVRILYICFFVMLVGLPGLKYFRKTEGDDDPRNKSKRFAWFVVAFLVISFASATSKWFADLVIG